MKAECMGGPLDGVVVELPDAMMSFVFTNFTFEPEPQTAAPALAVGFEHVYQAGLLYNSTKPVADAWLWQGML